MPTAAAPTSARRRDTPVGQDHGGSAPKLERMKDEKPFAGRGGGEKRRHARAGRTALAAALEGGQCPESEEHGLWRVQGVADQVLRRLQGDAAQCQIAKERPQPGYNAGFETTTTCGKLIGDVQERALAAGGSHENACFIV